MLKCTRHTFRLIYIKGIKNEKMIYGKNAFLKFRGICAEHE